MSAFVHGTDHIDLIVTAAYAATYPANSDFTYWHEASGGLHKLNDPTELGRLLISENVRSVLYRYADVPADEMELYADVINGYRFRRVEAFRTMPNHWLMALHACASLDYQSCESDNYRETAAAAALARIEKDVTLHMIQEAKVNAWAWGRVGQDA